MEAGTYNAKVVDYGVTTSSKKNTPGILVRFELELEDGETTQMPWTGWVSDGAIDNTIRQLKLCGFKGNDKKDLAAFVGGKKNKALDEEKVVPVTVENQPYEGKDRYKITWIGEGGGPKPLGDREAAQALASIGVPIGEMPAAEVPF